MPLLLGAGRQDTSASGRSAYKLCVYRRARSYSSRSISRFMTLPLSLTTSSALRGGLDVASLLHGCGHTVWSPPAAPASSAPPALCISVPSRASSLMTISRELRRQARMTERALPDSPERGPLAAATPPSARQRLQTGGREAHALGKPPRRNPNLS